MLNTITLLLTFQLIGEVIARFFQLPVPGPVIGMALLFLTLLLRSGLADSMRDTAQTLLQHLSLLFVPAGVGVMVHAQRLSDDWAPLLASLIGSTLLALAITALLMTAMTRRSPSGER
jgi:holin-like protein